MAGLLRKVGPHSQDVSTLTDDCRLVAHTLGLCSADFLMFSMLVCLAVLTCSCSHPHPPSGPTCLPLSCCDPPSASFSRGAVQRSLDTLLGRNSLALTQSMQHICKPELVLGNCTGDVEVKMTLVYTVRSRNKGLRPCHGSPR